MLKWAQKSISTNWLKLLISLVAIALVAIRIWLPELRIDAVSLGLMAAAVLPWLSELIESMKFPGGWEVKFRDLREAGAKVTAGATTAVAPAPSDPKLSFVAVAEHDPNLALVGLRIEIEKRLREYARRHQIDERKPLTAILRDLAVREILPASVVGGLKELIYAGNSAAHGARVQEGVSDWAMDAGPKIISALDEHLKE